MVEKAVYIKDINQEIWRIIQQSHQLVDSVLMAEKQVRQELGEDNIFEKDQNGQVKRNKFRQPIHSEEFTNLLNKKLNGMVERQMMRSIEATANFWYTAWVNAGKPDLSNMDPEEQTKESKKQLKKELARLKKGHLTNVKSESEFK